MVWASQPSLMRRRSLWLLPLLTLLALACGRGAPAGSTPGAASSGAAVIEATEPLPSRPLAVASADALAVEASRLGGSEGARALERAAVLRTRLFRREHREADALEALELRGQLARITGPLRCASEVERILLEGELNADVDGTYRALFALSRSATPPCASRVEAALAMLEAFRPSENLLTPPTPSAQ